MSQGGKARKIVVIGLLTVRRHDIEAAWSQAERIYNSGGLVLFVDQCPDYYPVKGVFNQDFQIHQTHESGDSGFRVRDYIGGHKVYNSRDVSQDVYKIANALWQGLKALWRLGTWFIRLITKGVRPRPKNSYNHRRGKRKSNILLIYLALAVLAVCFDMGQRLVTHFTQNQPQPQTVIYK